MFVGGIPVAALQARRGVAGALLDIDLTQGAGGLTCARSSIGTAIDASGVVQSFAANALRRTSAGLLVEVARTNAIRQSQALATTPWAVSSATLANNAATGPDGASSASSLSDASGTNTTFSVQQTNVSSSGSNVVSAFLKAGSRSWASLQINFGGDATAAYFNLTGAGSLGSRQTLAGSGTISSSSIRALANGWYLCSVVIIQTNGGDVYVTSASGDLGRT